MNLKFRGLDRSVGGALALAAAVVFFALRAQAAGSFQLRTTEVQEVSGGWHVIFGSITLPRAPSIAHTPMKFLFTKTMVYERALVDNSPQPVLNRTALVGQTPSVESLDVDFSDPSGKIYNRTRFDFSLTRTRGYEAGEYKLQVRTADGIDIGTPTTIILKGDNPVVDRRAMTFNAKESGIKKVDTGLDGGAKGPANPSDESNAAVPNNGEVVASGTAAPFIPADAFQKTPEEEAKEHPKGCGCAVPGRGGSGTPLLGGIPLALATAAARRRRRQSRSVSSNARP
jgi:MYXO-CTERM domain-containing protein